ncbi:Putative aliphatic sulfonates transport permease protein SsuC [Devosia equisanguinis]|uniref:Aliphatic sulfonates transport permease protein SsuC n=1 Tax=Devosia equisanguinis TaxID=2490941 RepID=A0A3S4CU68_9HYPH|nr:ABC transporter permease [Devosia equisanguinis]VDS05955.1 Putative aliphatic sulfonates transport permease protein SsuC [Devosia equisanguinis]
MRIALYRLIFLAGLIALWWLASTQVERNLVPSPWATALAARQLIAEGRLGSALVDSISIYLGGYGAAIIVGIPIGILMGTLRPLGKTLEVFVYALSATPRVAFIPLIIVFLGLGPQAKILIIFLGAVMPILINTYAGALNSDQELIEMARSVGAPRRRIFASIVLPGAVPFILVGLRVGATIGLINTVVAELYTAVKGLGGLLAIYGNTFRMAEYFVIVLTLALIGVIITEALRFLELRLGRWRRSDAVL